MTQPELTAEEWQVLINAANAAVMARGLDAAMDLVPVVRKILDAGNTPAETPAAQPESKE